MAWILVVSKNRIIAESICAELRENGRGADFSDKPLGGYAIAVIDRDSISESIPFENECGVVTFSTKPGADLVRPFDFEELLTLIDGLAVNGGERPDERLIDRLTEKERMVYDCLNLNRGRTVSVGEISKYVWNKDEPDRELVAVYIRYLRRKLEKDPRTRLIITVRGKGYRIG